MSRRRDGASRSRTGEQARVGTSRLGRSALIGAAALVALGAGTFVAMRARPRPPNVLLLVMDTTRADRCSVDGYERPTTPRLEEFARDGVVFRDAWSPANWTGSAHASLFTGLRVEHHGFHEANMLFLSAEFETLAERLAGAGYATACFSNNSVVAPQFGLTRGFQTVEPLHERKDRSYPWARETHEAAAAWAREQVKDGKPFFVFVNDMEPHLPYTPPPAVAARFVRGAPTPAEIEQARTFGFPRTIAYDLRVETLSDAQRGLLSDLYDGEIATLDAEIGRLLDDLRTDGLLDSTLVVIAGDHGENLGDHHLFEHSLGLHRTLCHVPLVVRFPGVFDGGRVVEDVVRLEDVYPTVLETCRLPVPAGLDGVGLSHDLPGRIARAMQARQEGQRTGMVEKFGASEAVTLLLRGADSVYDGRFHLIEYSDGAEELFDVAHDPGEAGRSRDVDPVVASRLRALLRPQESAAVSQREGAMPK